MKYRVAIAVVSRANQGNHLIDNNPIAAAPLITGKIHR
jgi:hypothetical protein